MARRERAVQAPTDTTIGASAAAELVEVIATAPDAGTTAASPADAMPPFTLPLIPAPARGDCAIVGGVAGRGAITTGAAVEVGEPDAITPIFFTTAAATPCSLIFRF